MQENGIFRALKRKKAATGTPHESNVRRPRRLSKSPEFHALPCEECHPRHLYQRELLVHSALEAPPARRRFMRRVTGTLVFPLPDTAGSAAHFCLLKRKSIFL